MIILEEPLLRSLLGNVQELSVADIGCGTGRHTLYLSEAGARVTAIDFAPEMMAQAIEKTKDHDVRFVTHDLTERLPFDNDTFDPRPMLPRPGAHFWFGSSNRRNGEDLSARRFHSHLRTPPSDASPSPTGSLH